MNRRSSLRPITDTLSSRHHLTLKEELLLATAPTFTVLGVMAVVEVLNGQRLLFASLAVSAFLIYLDPQHSSNSARSLVLSQLMAAAIGLLTTFTSGAGYGSAALAMVTTIIAMIVLNTVHPPAVATALSFAFSPGSKTNLALFSLAVGITALLVELERLILRTLDRSR